MKFKNKIFIIVFLLIFPLSGICQSDATIFNFQLINTNAQTAGFGDIGVASSASYYPVNSMQNPALVSQNSQSSGASFTYNSLNKFHDSYNYCVDGFYSIDSSHTFGLNYNRFKFDEFYDNDSGDGYYAGLYYSYTLNKYLSFGVKFKFLETSLAVKSKGISFDFGASFMDEFKIGHNSVFHINFGFSLLNCGPKVSGSYSKLKETESFNQPIQSNFGIVFGFRIKDKDKATFDFVMGWQYANVLTGSNSEDWWQDEYWVDKTYKDNHRFGLEIKMHLVENSRMVSFRTGISEINPDRYDVITFGARFGLYGFYIDYANKSSERWLLSCGFIYNMGNKFKFID